MITSHVIHATISTPSLSQSLKHQNHKLRHQHLVALVWQAVDAEGDEAIEHLLSIGTEVCAHVRPACIMRVQHVALTVSSMLSLIYALWATSLGKSPSELGIEGSAFATNNLLLSDQHCAFLFIDVCTCGHHFTVINTSPNVKRIHAGAKKWSLHSDDVCRIPIAGKVKGGVLLRIAMVNIRFGSDQGLRCDRESSHMMARLASMSNFVHI